MEIKEYILDHQDHYKNKFQDNINLRETLLSEHPLFKDEIDKSLNEYMRQGIALDVAEELAIDAETIYNVLDDISLFTLMDIAQ